LVLEVLGSAAGSSTRASAPRPADAAFARPFERGFGAGAEACVLLVMPSIDDVERLVGLAVLLCHTFYLHTLQYWSDIGRGSLPALKAAKSPDGATGELKLAFYLLGITSLAAEAATIGQQAEGLRHDAADHR
jgi:hypothetical protein